ncbi:cytochrome P450 6g1-like isoform X1 [Toxorhynchites rutilus septentrionalis]|uniref:cytochrome P450 6g1-like isoform X1 n=1 Tax=Toxorhynchites rutilus septentrionalis TaxID=329112 RepID=UPI00247A0DC1|nr:cytochrome P450 6g1-like isoform X1 [Toxorhynchites rutilus septentrionalis]
MWKCSSSGISYLPEMIYISLSAPGDVFTLALICLAGFFVWFASTSGSRYWKPHSLPYIEGKPFAGNFLDALLLRKSNFDLMDKLYNDVKVAGSELFGISILMQPAIVLRDPELIKQVLVKDAQYFGNRHMCTDPSSDPIGYYNLLMIKNPHWKQLRSYLTPSLSLNKIKKMYTLVDQIGKDMLDHLSCLPEKRPQVREVEFKELCARFTTDVIASTFFGIQANCLMDEQSEFRYYGRKIFEYGPKRGFTMATFFFLPELVPYLKLKLFPRDTEEFLKTIIQQEIFRREKNGETRGDFIDSMISLKRSNAFIGTNDRILLKDDILVAQAATFYMASFETTSSVLSFTLYELTKNPNIQKRLREEIRSSIQKYGSDLPYECLINEMPYLGMVISEAARLYPVLPFIERQCTLPVGVSGYKLEPFSDFVIPNRMPVLVPIYAIHRDPKFFPDPLRFNPERFAKENLDNIVPCSYMPFGVGPRTCLGSHFGTLQVKVAVVRILSTYRIGRSESTPEKLTYRKNAFTLQSNEGLSANLILDEL